MPPSLPAAIASKPTAHRSGRRGAGARAPARAEGQSHLCPPPKGETLPKVSPLPPPVSETPRGGAFARALARARWHVHWAAATLQWHQIRPHNPQESQILGVAKGNSPQKSRILAVSNQQWTHHQVENHRFWGWQKMTTLRNRRFWWCRTHSLEAHSSSQLTARSSQLTAARSS